MLNRMRFFLALVVTGLWFPHFAYAELTLMELAKHCEGSAPKPERPVFGILMCVSYIGGALDQIILADGLAVQGGILSDRTICGSEQGKIDKLSLLIKRAAEENPELRSKPARSVLRGLILGEFKCQ